MANNVLIANGGTRSLYDLDGKQNRTRNLVILDSIISTRTLDGTEDLIVGTGPSPTSVFDSGTLPIPFCLELRNDSAVNMVFNPDAAASMIIPPGASAILRQTAAGVWVNLLAGNILVGNTIFVDAVYGNDSTGTRQRQDLPFLTIAPAVAVASEGDFIVIRPGNYSAETISDSPTTPTTLHFYLESDANVNGVSQTNTSFWRFEGAPIEGNVTCSTGCEAAYYNRVKGNATITGGFLEARWSVSGILTISGGEASIYRACSNDVVVNGGTLNLIDCIVDGALGMNDDTAVVNLVNTVCRVNITNGGTTPAITAISSTVIGTVAAGITVTGNMQKGLVGPSAGEVPTANADGTWSWA